jgi:hypothetical protein
MSVLTIKRNIELAEKIIGNGRIIIEDSFSLETWIKKIEDLYLMIISDPNSKIQSG